MAPPSARERTRPVHSALPVKDLAVDTTDLTKDYGNERGIFDLDLSVPTGEVFGFSDPMARQDHHDPPAHGSYPRDTW